MRNLIVATIAFVLLVGGFITYMEIDKRKFIDNLSPVSPVVDQSVNGAETIREVPQENEEPKLHEMSPDEFVSELRRQLPEQFGYSEAVETYVELQEKRFKEGLTIDERVDYLEASLYLYPSEATQKSLILERWVQLKGPNFDPRDGFSDEDIAELRELGIPVVHRDNSMIINPPPDNILQEMEEKLMRKYRHIFDDPEYFPSSVPMADTVSSKGVGENTVSASAHSEISPVTPRPRSVGVLGKPDPIHLEKGRVHETPPVEDQEVQGWEGLSSEQREQAKQFFDQYGSEEGLRRLKESDPDAARQFERRPPMDRDASTRRETPSRDALDDGQSEP